VSDSFGQHTRSHLDNLLQRFRHAANPGPFAYEWAHHHDGGQHPIHVVFGVLVHGDERGSLPAAVQLVQALTSGELKFGGKLTIFVGNPEAAREDRRFLEADLNRVFLQRNADTHEDRRARLIMPILDAADVFLDFHQTILDTRQPFYITPWHTPGWHWARAIRSSPVWVTRDPRIPFSASSRCTDEYVAGRGKPGITVELSKKGFDDEAAKLCMRTMVDTLAHADEVGGGSTIEDLAARQPELSFFQTTFTEPFASPEMMLRPGLVNFQPVRAGQTMQAEGSPAITIPDDGMLLFPKYPPRQGTQATAPWPNDIYRLITPLPGHPLSLWED
jgi:succinylglutamate desuccinylase